MWIIRSGRDVVADVAKGTIKVDESTKFLGKKKSNAPMYPFLFLFLACFLSIYIYIYIYIPLIFCIHICSFSLPLTQVADIKEITRLQGSSSSLNTGAEQLGSGFQIILCVVVCSSEGVSN